MVILMTQGERVKFIRKSLNLTLEQFGSYIGIKKNSLSNVENGINTLTPQLAKSICREFNVSEDWLINGNGKEPFITMPSAALNEVFQFYHCDSFDRELVMLYLNLTRQERQAIKQKIQQLFLSIQE